MLRLDRIVVLTETAAPRRVVWKGTEGQFLASNADGIDCEEREILDSALERDGQYRIGGGAAPCFTVFNALDWLLKYGWTA